MHKNRLGFDLTLYNSGWVRNQVCSKIRELLEENVRQKFHDIGFDSDFLHITQRYVDIKFNFVKKFNLHINYCPEAALQSGSIFASCVSVKGNVQSAQRANCQNSTTKQTSVKMGKGFEWVLPRVDMQMSVNK